MPTLKIRNCTPSKLETCPLSSDIPRFLLEEKNEPCIRTINVFIVDHSSLDVK